MFPPSKVKFFTILKSVLRMAARIVFSNRGNFDASMRISLSTSLCEVEKSTFSDHFLKDKPES